MTTGLIWKLLTRAIALIAIAILGLEAYAFFSGPARYHAVPVALDGTLGWSGIPGFEANLKDEAGTYQMRLNDEGFRGRSIDDATSGGSESIFFFGDEELTGLSLREEDLVTSRLEEMLRSETGPSGGAGMEGASVFNRGIPDTGTGQQLLAQIATLEQASPDVVVLALHPSDDLIDDSLELVRESPRLPGDGLRPFVALDADGQPQVRYASPLRAKLRAASGAFALLERKLSGIFARRGMRPLDPFPAVAGPKARMERRAFPLVWMEMFRKGQGSESWENAWAQTFELIRGFQRNTEERGGRFLVAIVPSEHQVQRSARSLTLAYQVRKGLGLNLERLIDWNGPERRLEAFLADEGIEFVSLLEPLRAATREGARTYDSNGRLSATGHRIWAKTLHTRLQAGALAASHASDSNPVDLIPDAQDFPQPFLLADAEAAGILGAGWKPKSFVMEGDTGTEGRRGRWLQNQGRMLVPNRRGALVVRGFVPAHPESPRELAINLGNVIRSRHALPESGPFEIRFNVPPSREAIAIDGYIPIYLSPLLSRAGGAVPILIEQVSLSVETEDPADPAAAL